jgi:hypothetical protein
MTMMKRLSAGMGFEKGKVILVLFWSKLRC